MDKLVILILHCYVHHQIFRNVIHFCVLGMIVRVWRGNIRHIVLILPLIMEKECVHKLVEKVLPLLIHFRVPLVIAKLGNFICFNLQ